ncbi:putative conserved small protein [Thiorhodovibrio frisius]|uniref:Putative conserved small protein n=2 Tax=Thiorhodovibrio frisius TaxID=631362 RepID=H8Z1C1_9GAMM|nr:putative conserved small protein [Thiorhodovibrio frisius]WPL24022.1 hypothetical protein Thiofri_04233 [Thiorhodovibrio frisius]
MHQFDSVWDAIEDTPKNAEMMKVRSGLMMALQKYIARQGLSQAEAAKHFGVTPPRIAELINGQVNAFDVDALIAMAATAGLHCDIQIREAA